MIDAPRFAVRQEEWFSFSRGEENTGARVIRRYREWGQTLVCDTTSLAGDETSTLLPEPHRHCSNLQTPFLQTPLLQTLLSSDVAPMSSPSSVGTPFTQRAA